jgi:hypothetical protein
MYFAEYRLQYCVVYQEVPFVATVASQVLLVLLIDLHCSLPQDLHHRYEIRRIELPG